ncbi:transcription factor S-II-domain-containing protein [Tricharina praecox]|uniref:transcription factor S-II-domain-containing protein n=1 Tax=Tricharina praecox TaxID=43433 RepID=UPI00222038E7|nr:transcription factor S-II-domain-containing protein [Tricharina praecox]KAI5848370.1 transcription factor S-II-domain-containing protein [Tricharina praecox]
MSKVGTLVFCADCGNLLDRSPGSDKLTCEMCHSVTTDDATQSTTTQSTAAAFPSSLRLKRSAVQTIAPEDLHTEAKISQVCPECSSPEMWFYTLQLRSADEGATVFYRCECGHRFNTNN